MARPKGNRNRKIQVTCEACGKSFDAWIHCNGYHRRSCGQVCQSKLKSSVQVVQLPQPVTRVQSSDSVYRRVHERALQIAGVKNATR